MVDQKNTGSNRFKKFAEEPLTLFTAVAVGIFVYDAWFADYYDAPAEAYTVISESSVNDTVTVNDLVVEGLVENFTWMEGRAPTAQEKEQMIEFWVNEEVLFREALSQQMHLSDGKMRSHLIEKVRMIWAGSPEPESEADLLDHYLDNIEEYYTEPRVGFAQVFFQSKPENAAELLQELQAGGAVVGDNFWLGDTINGYAESILRSSFGGAFYMALESAPKGKWIGPLESPRGYHFVNVNDISESEVLPYAEVRYRVERDWIFSQRARAVSAHTEELKQGFTIVMETSDE